MPFDMQAMMSDPNFVAAMNAFAQSGYQPGANWGSRLGKAGLGTAQDLQRIETASANRTWRNKQSAIQEERNRIMQEMNQKRMELMQQQHKDEMAQYEGGPKSVKGEDGKSAGYTYGGRFYQKPKMSFEDMMMMSMFGGGMPIGLDPTGGGAKPPSAADVNKSFGPQSQAPTTTPMDVNANTGGQDWMMKPRFGGAPPSVGFQPGGMPPGPRQPMPGQPVTPAQKMAQDRMSTMKMIQEVNRRAGRGILDKSKDAGNWFWNNMVTNEIPYGFAE